MHTANTRCTGNCRYIPDQEMHAVMVPTVVSQRMSCMSCWLRMIAGKCPAQLTSSLTACVCRTERVADGCTVPATYGARPAKEVASIMRKHLEMSVLVGSCHLSTDR